MLPPPFHKQAAISEYGGAIMITHLTLTLKLTLKLTLTLAVNRLDHLIRFFSKKSESNVSGLSNIGSIDRRRGDSGKGGIGHTKEIVIGIEAEIEIRHARESIGTGLRN